jgi:peptidyl-tRNA hydrolase
VPIEPVYDGIDSPEVMERRKADPDPWLMYLIVRESLNLSPGKIASQCGHAVQMIMLRYFKLSVERTLSRHIVSAVGLVDYDHLVSFHMWLDTSYRKGVLRADDKEWEKLKEELPCFLVRDAGLTEVESCTETVIGLWPMRKSEAPKLVRRLRVL